MYHYFFAQNLSFSAYFEAGGKRREQKNVRTRNLYGEFAIRYQYDALNRLVGEKRKYLTKLH